MPTSGSIKEPNLWALVRPSSVRNESEPRVIVICSCTCDFFQHFSFVLFFLCRDEEEEQTAEGNLTHLLTFSQIKKINKKINSPSNLSKVWIKGGLPPTIPATFRHSHQLHAAIAPAVRRWGSTRGLNVFLALFIYRDISLNNCSICTAFCKTVNVPKMGAVVAFQGDLLERL